MENNKKPLNWVNVLLILVLVTIIGSVIFMIVLINRTFDATISPIREVNAGITTQMAQLLNPTPTVIPDPVTIIREVQSLARLETIQYSVEKIITAEINQGAFGPFFGDRLLFVAHGYVIAGIDLAAIEADNLRLADGVLYVTLPEAEVFVATLNNDKSYIYDRETGFFRKSDPKLETSARQAAEEEILKGAIADGILDQARLNAEVYLERLFNTLGYQQVVFVSR